MKSTVLFVSCLVESAAFAAAYTHGSFVPSSSSSFSTSFHSKISKPQQRVNRNSSHLHGGMVMFQDNLNRKDTNTPSSPIQTPSSPTSNSNSFTKIGNLVVPSVGIGTISWSSQSLTTLENLELQTVVNEAMNQDSAFIDNSL